MEHNKAFLTLISEQDFENRFGDIPSVIKVFTPEGHLRRLAIVLPLYVRNNEVIPIPMIVDTGAPDYLYLGTGAFHILEEAQLLKDVVSSNAWPYRLLGTLRRGEKCIKKPFVDRLPKHYEENILGDVRLNVLGLSAIHELDIIIRCSTV